MKPIYKTFRAQICACLFAFALLQGLNASITTESIGIGESVEAAKKDAIANAVRESIGEYVRTKQVLEDENLNEKIIGFSNAYVLDYKQLSANKNQHGLYEVKAQVEIEDGKLVGVLKDLNVDVKDMNSGTFKVYVDESHKKAENFQEAFQATVIEPLKSGEAWETKILKFDPLELTEIYQYCRDEVWWCYTFKMPKDPKYKAYVLTLSIKYQKGYLEGVKKLLSSAGQVCDSNESESNGGCRAPYSFFGIGGIRSASVVRFYTLAPAMRVLWSLRINDLFQNYVQSELNKFDYGKLQVRFFDANNREFPPAKRFFTPNYFQENPAEGNDAVAHVNKHKLAKFSGEEYNAAKEYDPNRFLVPYGGKFLVDAPDIMVVVYLTQEEVKKLSEIKASFSLKKQ